MDSERQLIDVLSEPMLEFRHGQAVVDPHDGLAVFGPFDADAPYHPSRISYGLVATPRGAAAFQAFSSLLDGPVYPPADANPRLWPTFPGFEVTFESILSSKPTRFSELDRSILDTSSLHGDPNKRAAKVVDLYLSEIRRICEGDERIDVIVCVVPDFIYDRCRPRSWIAKETRVGAAISSTERKRREAGQIDMWDRYDPSIYRYSVDFRRQLKARSMEHGVPIQIVQESTLVPEDSGPPGRRGLTCLSDRAWNLSVGLYYKAGGKPWRLKSAREGVCYIGLAYRRKDPTSESRSAACAAQMFLDSGDGIVFMGRYGPWYSGRGREFHLERDAARQLLEGTLRTYRDLQGPALEEIFLHCRSNINEEEFAGFQEACPEDVKLVGVRVRKERFEVRLLREGTRAVLRGTFWELGGKRGYLWASGFKPRLGTYDGWEVPVPLRIEVQHGDVQVRQVAEDILGLTKLNYNACKLGDSEPVTVGFSDKVGEILVSNPDVVERSPKFKFYI